MSTLGSILFRTGVILALAPVGMMYLTWLERKILARIQNRVGPNRAGPYGLLQPLADGVKMFTKEDAVPAGSDRLLHFGAPILIVVPALLLFTLLPFGPQWVAAPLATGLLFFVAVGSVQTLAIFMAAWGSRNKFALLGGARTVAQLIAYEVPLVLSLAVIPMATGSLRMTEVVQAQQGIWFAATPWGFVAFLLALTAGLAEVNRTPFDLAEAESELIGGFHTEYSGMKFALFYMAEFLSMLALALLVSVLFLGGWLGPILPGGLWLGLKSFTLVFVMIWFRGTFPRVRVDQLMGFAWKVLLPIALANLMAAGFCMIRPGWISSLGSALFLLGVFLVTTQIWLRPRPHCTTDWVETVR